jgi:hypothetical protein
MQHRSRHIGNIGGRHAHLGPHQPLAQRLVIAAHQARERLALTVVVIGLHLQIARDPGRIDKAVIGKQQHMAAHVRQRLHRIDDDGAIAAHHLLQARMAVIPIGAVLGDREFIGEAGARRDAGKDTPGTPSI